MLRIYVERKGGFDNEAGRVFSDVTGFLRIAVRGVRFLNRYDIENVPDDVAECAVRRIFFEPQSDNVFSSLELGDDETAIVWEYLPGQYDQRADSAEQCLSLLQKTFAELSGAGGAGGSARVGGASSDNGRGSETGGTSVDASAPRVRTAKVVVLKGEVSARDLAKIQDYLVNPVDSRLASDAIPETLKIQTAPPEKIPIVEGFVNFSEAELSEYRKTMSLAMDDADIKFLQDYFKKEGRNPTETEIRVLDTYWSDHCRHTTFLTELTDIQIEAGEYEELFSKSLAHYKSLRASIYENNEKPITLMDMATCAMKHLRKIGMLSDMEASDENNACSIYVDVHYTDNRVGAVGRIGGTGATGRTEAVTGGGKQLAAGADIDGTTERWLLMFKNETHNHPTEIEPFGGAATCIGGAIRDPLSGRSWVYQSMRITGAADPTVALDQTMRGKLPQLKLVRESAQGFSSYGNQIGLATGQVNEIYHAGYAAKRMELGAVIAAAPEKNVVRGTPQAGDIVILLGGGTGRDGIGGATGSSKVHTEASVSTAAAEVQKGNAVEERKIQRFFRNKEVSLMIVRCNDFGAGGVSVAVGELAQGLDINLDAVPKKYEGLNGTELAISESQERMAVVVRPEHREAFIKAAASENLNAVVVATVTDTNRLVMKWRGDTIVNLSREFLDSAGARHEARAVITMPSENSPLLEPLAEAARTLCAYDAEASCRQGEGLPRLEGLSCRTSRLASLGLQSSASPAFNNREAFRAAFFANISDLACCSQRGLVERFDASIGAATVLFPYGGKYQCTPEAGMVAKFPVLPPYETDTASVMAYGFDPRISEWSPWHGAQIAVLSSLTKLLCLGANPMTARLSFQEFFGRTTDEKSWGYPAAALLGAIEAQTAMGTASIGGKDSMSGTFEDLNVPHTLVSFAVAHESVQNITSGAFKKAASKIYLVSAPYSKLLAPDFEAFKHNAALLHKLNSSHKISAMYPICAGGVAEAITKMCMGNRIGAALDFASDNALLKDARAFFLPLYGSLIVETDEDLSRQDFAKDTLLLLGSTISEAEIKIRLRGSTEQAADELAAINLSDAQAAWESRLASVFAPVSNAKAQNALPEFATKTHKSLSDARKNPVFSICKSRPNVLIPVFPGTNCEYDTARAFAIAGASPKIFVFRNNSPAALETSLAALAKEIGDTQILAFAGGFSAGDEPDGSGKYIANVVREGRVAEQIMALLQKRGGLILGICNGFQALIKTGLVPYGEIKELTAQMPTLTFNTVGRHISRVARTRMVSAISPWAQNASVIDARIHLVPISHGEGRIIIQEETAARLFESGQIFSQYVDENGRPAILEPDNPNGSLYAIEGMTSPDGRVLGKMGHSERTIGLGMNGASVDLIKNIAGNPLTNKSENSCQNIFAAGVSYFK